MLVLAYKEVLLIDGQPKVNKLKNNRKPWQGAVIFYAKSYKQDSQLQRLVIQTESVLHM